MADVREEIGIRHSLKRLNIVPGMQVFHSLSMKKLGYGLVVMVTIPSGAEIVTFLPLQIALYFNVWYSPLWMVSSIVALVNKVIPLCLCEKEK